MSLVIEEIKRTNVEAAKALEEAGFRTDSEIQSLTRTDLNELFPGRRNLKLRRLIFEIIQKQEPIDLLLKNMKGFIPDESFRAALTDDGVLVRYLCILKNIKSQVNNVQLFLDAHINLLENVNKSQADLQPNRGSLSGTSTSATYGPVEPHYDQNSSYSQGPQETKTGRFSNFMNISSEYPRGFTQQTQGTVMYKMVVSGMTFNAHLQLLDKVKPKGQDCEFVCVDQEQSQSNQDYQILIVFCPITSRAGTDVEAAMRDIKDDKPVILVLMHHIHEPKTTSTIRTWGDYRNVELCVDVFFHETVHGLLDCQQNNEAAALIQRKLLEYKIMTNKDTSGKDAARSGNSSNCWN